LIVLVVVVTSRGHLIPTNDSEEFRIADTRKEFGQTAREVAERLESTAFETLEDSGRFPPEEREVVAQAVQAVLELLLLILLPTAVEAGKGAVIESAGVTQAVIDVLAGGRQSCLPVA
jgi:hypothetical protein